MKTITMLFARFETAAVGLEDVAQEYFGLSPEQAKRQAGRGELPVPAFRMGKAKAPWLIHLEDLAKHIDQAREQAKTDHQKLHA